MRLVACHNASVTTDEGFDRLFEALTEIDGELVPGRSYGNHLYESSDLPGRPLLPGNFKR